MRELAETLVTLPIPLIAVLVLGLMAWRRRRLSLILIGSATAALVGLSMPVVASLLERPLVAAAPAFDAAGDPPTAAIVVPTAGIYEDPAGGWWSSASSIRRAVAARKLQHDTGLPLLLIGGSPEGEDESEAMTVARQVGLIGRANGNAEPPVYMETGARNSAETALAAKLLLERLGGNRVVLVTTPSHIARMAASLRRAGLEVSAHPARAPAKRRRPLGAAEAYVPSAKGLALSTAAVREYVAIVWYLANGYLQISDLRGGA